MIYISLWLFFLRHEKYSIRVHMSTIKYMQIEKFRNVFICNLPWAFITSSLYLRFLTFFTIGALNAFTKSFLGFSVYVSNTTDKETGTLCFKDTNFTTDTIPTVFTTICSVHGQYVIYYNERLIHVTYPDYYSLLAENNVCEVEVYGESSQFLQWLYLF